MADGLPIGSEYHDRTCFTSQPDFALFDQRTADAEAAILRGQSGRRLTLIGTSAGKAESYWWEERTWVVEAAG